MSRQDEIPTTCNLPSRVFAFTRLVVLSLTCLQLDSTYVSWVPLLYFPISMWVHVYVHVTIAMSPRRNSFWLGCFCSLTWYVFGSRSCSAFHDWWPGTIKPAQMLFCIVFVLLKKKLFKGKFANRTRLGLEIHISLSRDVRGGFL